MKITCISDLHGHYPELPGGDLLIVAGDLTARGTNLEYTRFSEWYLEQDYKKKVLIAGNHDTKVQRGGYHFNPQQFGYLEDSGTEFEGLKIWGSPWTQWFRGVNPHCKAFMLSSEEKLAKKWALIPDDVDILVTHSPPFGALDQTTDGRQVGSRSLDVRAKQLPKLKLHVWGHIHEAYGIWPKIIQVNASHMNERYEPVNEPISLELDLNIPILEPPFLDCAESAVEVFHLFSDRLQNLLGISSVRF